MQERQDSHTDMNCNGDIPVYPAYKNGESVPCLPQRDMLATGQHKKSTSPRPVDLTVHIADGNSGYSRRWTYRERFLLCVCILLFVACLVFLAVAFLRFKVNQDNVPQTSNICLTRDCIRTATQLIDALDETVHPCDDFFQFACGNWNKKNIIPEDKPSFNTFEKLHDDLQIKLKVLLEEGIKQYDGEATRKVKTLYKSCMNLSQIERVGDEPLRNLIRTVGGFPSIEPLWREDTFSVEDMLGIIRGKYNTPVVMYSSVGPDDKNSSVNIIQLDQPEFGLPSRHYYLEDKGSMFLRSYLRYMIDIAVLLGAEETSAKTDMEKVLAFETRLANVSKPDNERHDTGALYTKITIRELRQRVPQFDWMKYFSRFIPYPLDDDEYVVTFGPEYLAKMADIIQNTDKRTVANYIVVRTIIVFIPELTASYRAARREYRRISEGISKDLPRWQKCVEFSNKNLGMILGAMFIRDNFHKESKETALQMIHNIRSAFNELLHENDWMDQETRAVAMEKANAMTERIGYPDFITNKSKLDEKFREVDIDVNTYVENALRLEWFEAKNTMKKLREPVDKNQWEQDPAVVNAFYNPNTNDIVFPAGILQPPFYSDIFPKSLNYGGIGVVIGHEITHGFDDKGRQYDKLGNLKQWWDNATIASFRQRAQCMIDQYSTYKLEQIGMNIDGKNTQGENIADNGGLKQAYRAYIKWVEKNGEEKLLPGLNLTHKQLFFLNYAQIWCGNMRNEEALEKIRTSVHSPGPIRVLGPLSNSKDFSEAFQCPKGSRMNPIHKCSIW